MEGDSVLGNIAMTVGDLAIERGIPFPTKKELEAGRYYASEALRDPKLQKKAINYMLDKAHPVFEKLAVRCSINFQPKFDQTDATKQTDWIKMGRGLTFIQRLENSPNQNGVGRYRAIVIPGHITPLNSR